ncbi:MAG: SDR family oxidoreductase [Kofleriaceae bacterium]
MSKPSPLRLRALVTGASSGIGLAIATQLAARGCDLVLSARRQPLLDELAATLRAQHPALQIDVVACDLGRPGGAEALWTAATAARPVDILVNNAGFGTFRAFTTGEWARDAELLQLNLTSLVELCHHFVGAALAGGSGPAYLLNVASIAAYQSIPNFANYGASKAYVRNFSEALHAELAGTRVRVTCLCPGGTKTPFHEAAGAGDYGAIANASMMTAEAVAAVGLAAMFAGKRTVIPGLLNKISCFSVRLVPRSWASWLSGWVLGRPRAEPLPPRR